jgi:hypothetical protein
MADQALQMESLVAEAKVATTSLLQKVKPHMDDALGLMTLGDFLPVASQALDMIGVFEAEVPVVLQQYKSTCDRLTAAIQTEDSGGQRAWKDVTVDGKSWLDHTTTLQSYIKVLQVQAIEKKLETPLPKYDEPPPYNAKGEAA